MLPLEFINITKTNKTLNTSHSGTKTLSERLSRSCRPTVINTFSPLVLLRIVVALFWKNIVNSIGLLLLRLSFDTTFMAPSFNASSTRDFGGFYEWQAAFCAMACFAQILFATVRHLPALSHSTACVERIFSQVNLIKTKQANALKLQ